MFYLINLNSKPTNLATRTSSATSAALFYANANNLRHHLTCNHHQLIQQIQHHLRQQQLESIRQIIAIILLVPVLLLMIVSIMSTALMHVQQLRNNFTNIQLYPDQPQQHHPVLVRHRQIHQIIQQIIQTTQQAANHLYFQVDQQPLHRLS